MRVGNQEFEVSTEPYQGGWRSVAFVLGGQRASATWDTREAAEMDLYRKLKDEFAPTPKFDPTRRYEAEDPKGVFRNAVASQIVGYVITWVDTIGRQHVSHLQATSKDDAIDTLHFGYHNVAHIVGLEPMTQADYLAHYGDLPLGSTHKSMSEARAIIDNLDSLEGGADDRMASHRYAEQFPRKPEWHPGHRSSRMSLNRNNRRKSFGYTDPPSSLRDRGWPYANRGYDRRKKAWEKAVARFGQVRPGEGI